MPAPTRQNWLRAESRGFRDEVWGQARDLIHRPRHWRKDSGDWI